MFWLLLNQFLIAAPLTVTITFVSFWFFRRLAFDTHHFDWAKRFFIPLFIAIYIMAIRNQSELYRFLQDYRLEQWSQVIIILSLLWVSFSVVKLVEIYLYRVFDITKEDNLASRTRRTQIQFLQRIVTMLFIFVAVGCILLSFDSIRRLGASLLASAGIAGLVIGFASQKIVANLLAGFQIAFSQPLRIDDVVVIDGEWGRIEEIRATYVVVKIWDLRRLIVPLSRLLEKPFENWSRTSTKLLGSVILNVDYRVPVEAIRKEVTKILNATPLWDRDVNVVQVVDSQLNSMQIRILVSSNSPSINWDLRCLVREKIIDYLNLAYPGSLGEISVRLKDKSHQTAQKPNTPEQTFLGN